MLDHKVDALDLRCEVGATQVLHAHVVERFLTVAVLEAGWVVNHIVYLELTLKDSGDVKIVLHEAQWDKSEFTKKVATRWSSFSSISVKEVLDMIKKKLSLLCVCQICKICVKSKKSTITLYVFGD